MKKVPKELNIDAAFFQLLDSMLEERYIGAQKHPTADLYIYNYMPKTQFEWLWNSATLQCRGLILDGNRNIVARPLAKFFNMEELDPTCIPNEPFDVYEKMDGSLGILYFLGGKPYVASRGSFTSEQAMAANAMLNGQYAAAIPQLNPEWTYLFEIIYPENRIVVNYGEMKALVLLAIIDKKTGKDLPLVDIGIPVVKHYDGLNDLSQLKAQEEDNREGFIVKFKSGLRMKVKFEEYTRLHRIFTNVSSKSIWECLSTGTPMDEVLDRVPDEFYDWVRETEQALRRDFARIEQLCKEEYKDLGNRKDNAFYYSTCKHPSVLFKMLDGRSYDEIIWKEVMPKYERPFHDYSDPVLKP